MSNYVKLHKCAFGLAIGVTWGLGVLLCGIIAWLTGWGEVFVTSLGSVYVGYASSLVGSLIGAVWALVDGFIAGFIIAWLYNCFSCCCCKRSCDTDSCKTESSE